MKRKSDTEKSLAELVTIQRNDAFTNTYIIAQNVGYAHKDITSHVTKHKKRFDILNVVIN